MTVLLNVVEVQVGLPPETNKVVDVIKWFDLLYADDDLLLAFGPETLQSILTILEIVASKYNMRLKFEKKCCFNTKSSNYFRGWL